MPDRSRKKKPPKRKPADEDVNETAARIIAEATSEDEDSELAKKARMAAARLLGSRGGKRGGPARARALTKKRRTEIARKAAKSRWDKEKGNEGMTGE